MTHIELDKGPGTWHLHLATFDQHPTGGGTRELSFTMKSGPHFSLTLTGLRLPPSDHSNRNWIITGTTTSLPDGYYYSSREMTIHWDLYRQTGHTELEMTSPCCGGRISQPRLRRPGEPTFGYCSRCQADVTLILGNEEFWLHNWVGVSIDWTDKDAELRPVVRLT